MLLAGKKECPSRRLRTGRKILETWKTCPLDWNRTSETFQRVVVKKEILKFGKPVKQSSRNGRKLIVVEIEIMKFGELVKQSSRNGRKLIIVKTKR